MGDSNPFENVCEIMRLAGVHRTVPLDNFTLMRLKTLDSLLYGYCSSAGLAMPHAHAEGDSTKVEDANSLYFTRLAVKVGKPIDTSENWLWAMDRLAQAIRCRLTGSDIQQQIAEGTSAGSEGPTPIAETESGSVLLFDRHEAPIVNGNEKPTLTNAQYDVVLALLQTGDIGLTKDRLNRESGHGDARKILKRLSDADSDWQSVIPFPGTPGKGYRII